VAVTRRPSRTRHAIAALPELLTVAEAASHALWSYAYENGSPELARACAVALDQKLARVTGCDYITSGNADKPKQHGADPHAKTCAIYAAPQTGYVGERAGRCDICTRDQPRTAMVDGLRICDDCFYRLRDRPKR